MSGAGRQPLRGRAESGRMAEKQWGLRLPKNPLRDVTAEATVLCNVEDGTEKPRNP